jgi:hypothetical protein
MGYWGKAFVLGPNINAPMDEAAGHPAVAALAKAQAHAPYSAPETMLALPDPGTNSRLYRRHGTMHAVWLDALWPDASTKGAKGMRPHRRRRKNASGRPGLAIQPRLTPNASRGLPCGPAMVGYSLAWPAHRQLWLRATPAIPGSLTARP